MKPSLQLRISQNLAMTPQLQQAIRLLQLSTLELRTEIQNALDSNMMLELDEGDEDAEPVGDAADPVESDNGEEPELQLRDEIDAGDLPEDIPVDTAWDDVYDGNLGSTSSTVSAGDLIDSGNAATPSLAEHLLWQLNLIPLSETDRTIAFTIVDFIDKDGYLTCPLEELSEVLDPELEAGIEEVTATLHLIQSLEPAGVGARDLAECLTLQLRQLDPTTPWLAEARRIIDQHMDLLGSRDYNQLMRRMSLCREELSAAIALIQSLNPRPGGLVQDAPVQYIVPDIYVRRDQGRWLVELNSEVTPRLRINNGYAEMIRRADNSPQNNSLKEHLQEARWLIKSLQSRSETLLRVATAIVERQQPFLEQGEQAMKPLILHDIAEQLGMHESTISRVTTNKYMHTLRGIYELKFFFSSHVSTDDGGAASSTAIRAHIRKMIGEEDPKKPLSDSKIATLLSKQGIQVARRTVAKYREALTIPPSNERKRLL